MVEWEVDEMIFCHRSEVEKLQCDVIACQVQRERFSPAPSMPGTLVTDTSASRVT